MMQGLDESSHVTQCIKTILLLYYNDLMVGLEGLEPPTKRL